jgi:hypothetical protein
LRKDKVVQNARSAMQRHTGSSQSPEVSFAT